VRVLLHRLYFKRFLSTNALTTLQVLCASTFLKVTPQGKTSLSLVEFLKQLNYFKTWKKKLGQKVCF